MSGGQVRDVSRAVVAAVPETPVVIEVSPPSEREAVALLDAPNVHLVNVPVTPLKLLATTASLVRD